MMEQQEANLSDDTSSAHSTLNIQSAELSSELQLDDDRKTDMSSDAATIQQDDGISEQAVLTLPISNEDHERTENPSDMLADSILSVSELNERSHSETGTVLSDLPSDHLEPDGSVSNLHSVHPATNSSPESSKSLKSAVPAPPAPHDFTLPDDDSIEKHKQSSTIESPSFSRFQYCNFLIQGIALLLPWNGILAVGYGFIGNHFNTVIIIYAFSIFMISLIFSIFGNQLLPSKKSLLSTILIVSASLGLTLCFGLSLMNVSQFKAKHNANPSLDLEKFDWRNATWFRLLFLFFIEGMAVAGAIGNNGIFGMLAGFENSAILMQAFLNGQGSSGLITGIISYIVAVFGSNKSELDQKIFNVKLSFFVFLFQIVFPIAALVLYLGPFLRSQEYLRYLKCEKSESSGSEEKTEGENIDATVQIERTAVFPTEDLEEPKKKKKNADFSQLKEAFYVGFRYELSVFLVLLVTLVLLCNPAGFLSNASLGTRTSLHGFERMYLQIFCEESNNLKIHIIKIMPCMLLLMFQIGDFLGRMMPLIKFFNHNNPSAFLVGSLARALLLVWTFARSTFMKKHISHFAINWLTKDWLAIFMFLLVGISNGYLCSLVMMHANSCVPKGRLKLAEMVNMLMPLCLFAGILAGSLAGKGFEQIL